MFIVNNNNNSNIFDKFKLRGRYFLIKYRYEVLDLRFLVFKVFESILKFFLGFAVVFIRLYLFYLNIRIREKIKLLFFFIF